MGGRALLAERKGVGWSIASRGEGSGLEHFKPIFALFLLPHFPPSFSSTDAERHKTCEVLQDLSPLSREVSCSQVF